jgi:hypothetical protein
MLSSKVIAAGEDLFFRIAQVVEEGADYRIWKFNEVWSNLVFGAALALFFAPSRLCVKDV